MPAAPTPVKSADRALAVLDHLAAAGPSTFGELLTALQLPKSSASGLLGTLEASGWIERDARRRYVIGLRAWQVGRSYRGNEDIVARAAPIMDELAITTGETVQLARLDGVHNVYIGLSPSPHPMRLASAVGLRLPSHATGIGKALLSQLEPGERERRVRAATLDRLTDRTVTDPDVLLWLLGEIADRGWAVDDEEYVEGCRCVAVPLGTGELGAITALSVTSPTFRTGDAWPGDVLAPLRDAAGRIRATLGLDPR